MKYKVFYDWEMRGNVDIEAPSLATAIAELESAFSGNTYKYEWDTSDGEYVRDSFHINEHDSVMWNPRHNEESNDK
jgi:hypothetical protein